MLITDRLTQPHLKWIRNPTFAEIYLESDYYI